MDSISSIPCSGAIAPYIEPKAERAIAPVKGLITTPAGPGAVGILLPSCPPAIAKPTVEIILGTSTRRERGSTSRPHNLSKALSYIEGSSAFFCFKVVAPSESSV